MFENGQKPKSAAELVIMLEHGILRAPNKWELFKNMYGKYVIFWDELQMTSEYDDVLVLLRDYIIDAMQDWRYAERSKK